MILMPESLPLIRLRLCVSVCVRVCLSDVCLCLCLCSYCPKVSSDVEVGIVRSTKPSAKNFRTSQFDICSRLLPAPNLSSFLFSFFFRSRYRSTGSRPPNYVT
ncbi:hypothetical protein BO70DRAFT_31781 [Aspergillus heteromorphus CBS 117.55]|uniref:Secreted protein n=1 Tax=Aspergillus heteromorphus CBS 117.55 TaxID=1448321 RepID=A0A317W9R9_9EURO|nr:uncharacterized protein BO70DRAFT_31781 [Aspergillus heteromorphus CBS 117.55]PWY82909.1 hypothetical protein BO70DRAFT_31781 [Aspergillus heteromorphus CBS 117.55]